MLYIQQWNGGYKAHTGDKAEWEFSLDFWTAVHKLKVSFPHLQNAEVRVVD